MPVCGTWHNEVLKAAVQHLGPEPDRLVVLVTLQKLQDILIQEQGVEIRSIVQKCEQLAPVQNGNGFTRGDGGALAQGGGRNKIGDHSARVGSPSS